MSERPPFGPDYWIFVADHPEFDLLPSVRPACMYHPVRLRRYLGNGVYQIFTGTEASHARLIYAQRSAIHDMIAGRINEIGA